MALAILVFRGTIPNILMLPPYWWGSWELWECLTLRISTRSDNGSLIGSNDNFSKPISAPASFTAVPLISSTAALAAATESHDTHGASGCPCLGGFHVCAD